MDHGHQEAVVRQVTVSQAQEPGWLCLGDFRDVQPMGGRQAGGFMVIELRCTGGSAGGRSVKCIHSLRVGTASATWHR